MRTYWTGRSQSGSYKFNPQEIILNQLARNNLILLKEHFRSKNITVNCNVDSKHIVYADQNMIDIVFRNLISNAIKFTPVGGKICIYSNDSENTNYISISIIDTGIGIPEDKIGDLFRMDKSYSTEGNAGVRGTELELLLCSEFIDKNGGKMRVGSEVGKGSTFLFTISKA